MHGSELWGLATIGGPILLFIVIAFALLSWLWIEKPFLKVKPYVLGQKQWRKSKASALAPAE